MAPALPCDDFSLIALICIFTHLLENKKSRQLHGPRSEPGKEWGSFGALHPLYAAPVMGAGKTAEKWQKNVPGFSQFPGPGGELMEERWGVRRLLWGEGAEYWEGDGGGRGILRG